MRRAFTIATSATSIAGALGSGVVVSDGTSLSAATNVTAGSGFVAIGANPAGTGALRLANATSVVSRNQANDGNVTIAGVTSSNQVKLGGTDNSGVLIDAATSQTVALRVNSTTIVEVGATYLSVGSTAASAGGVRLSQASSIKAKQTLSGGASDLNLCSWDASDIVTYGGTVNAGIRIDTATSSTIALRVNSTAILTVGATFASIGTTVASAGTIRLTTGAQLNYRNNGDTADIGGVSHSGDANNRLFLGHNLSSCTRPTDVYLQPSSSVAIIPNGTTRAIFASSAATGIDFIYDRMALGSGTCASSGLIRANKNVTLLAARNNGNTGDISVIGTDSSDSIVLGDGTNTLVYKINGSSITQTTIGAAGAASAMPTPLGYLKVTINGTAAAVAYFNP